MARRRSGVTSTCVTVTNPTRGSLSRGISSARISRNSSATRSGLVPSPIVDSSLILRRMERHRRVDQLDAGKTLHVPLDLVDHLGHVKPLAGHRRHADGRALPQLLVADLSN